MTEGTALVRAEQVVRTMAETAVANETYFCELDAVVGDGDFGYSLARGFEKLLEEWERMDYADVGGFLKKTAMILTSRIGGTSGPIWGTAFLRAGVALTPITEPGGEDVVGALRAAIEGIAARGKASVGDKTLLDALVPATDRLEQELAVTDDPVAILAATATTAREAAEATKNLVARRGRASYAGERSLGSPDAGAVAVAVMLEAIAASWTTNDPDPSLLKEEM
ncbi:MAG TPA: dihydroxyacetone kinase subunit DhaL [Solirubrobacterales bacterium]|nr:dihydroxyacetone kinase subunit DhaL [Solirubrobacterales bacterium]